MAFTEQPVRQESTQSFLAATAPQAARVVRALWAATAATAAPHRESVRTASAATAAQAAMAVTVDLVVTVQRAQIPLPRVSSEATAVMVAQQAGVVRVAQAERPASGLAQRSTVSAAMPATVA
jgi:hypothetical protein